MAGDRTVVFHPGAGPYPAAARAIAEGIGAGTAIFDDPVDLRRVVDAGLAGPGVLHIHLNGFGPHLALGDYGHTPFARTRTLSFLWDHPLYKLAARLAGDSRMVAERAEAARDIIADGHLWWHRAPILLDR